MSRYTPFPERPKWIQNTFVVCPAKTLILPPRWETLGHKLWPMRNLNDQPALHRLHNVASDTWGFMLHLDPWGWWSGENVSSPIIDFKENHFGQLASDFETLESDMAGDDWTPNHLAVWLKCVCVFVYIILYNYMHIYIYTVYIYRHTHTFQWYQSQLWADYFVYIFSFMFLPCAMDDFSSLYLATVDRKCIRCKGFWSWNVSPWKRTDTAVQELLTKIS